MTNKLPEVGKRYKGRNYADYLVEVVSIKNENAVYWCESDLKLEYCPIHLFLRSFEPLEDNSQKYCGSCGGTGEICLLSLPPQYKKCDYCLQNTSRFPLFSPQMIINGVSFFEVKNDKVLILGRECFSNREVEEAFKQFLIENGFLKTSKANLQNTPQSAISEEDNRSSVSANNTQAEPTIRENGIVDKVEKVKEKLRQELELKETAADLRKTGLLDGFFRLYDKSKALLDALDEQFVNEVINEGKLRQEGFQQAVDMMKKRMEEGKAPVDNLNESEAKIKNEEKNRYKTTEEANAWNRFCGFPEIKDKQDMPKSEPKIDSVVKYLETKDLITTIESMLERINKLEQKCN